MTDEQLDLTPGRFTALTGLTDKALRLYAERGLLLPAGLDPTTGYRSYGTDQIRDGITLDLLRRARIPLSDLGSRDRLRFDDHRARLAARRAMEDFYLDLAECVARSDPLDLEPRARHADTTHWIGVDVPLYTSSPEEAETTFLSMAAELPELDRRLISALETQGIDVAPESWTASTGRGGGRMLLAHRVVADIPDSLRRRLEEIVAAGGDSAVHVATGTLPPRDEVVFARPRTAVSDDAGIDDMAFSYLSTLAFAHHLARYGGEALSDTARRRFRSVSVFDASVVPDDVYDLVSADRWPTRRDPLDTRSVRP